MNAAIAAVSQRDEAIKSALVSAVVSSTTRLPTRQRVIRRTALGAAGLAVGFAIGVVVQLPTQIAQDVPVSQLAQTPDYSHFGDGTVGDYQTFVSTTEMADVSPLIFRGTVVGTSSLPPIPGATIPRVVTVLELKVDAGVKGQLPVSSDGLTRLILPSTNMEDGMPDTDAAVLFPVGTEIVTYAGQGWINESSSFQSDDPNLVNAEPVAFPITPQGLAVQVTGSDVVAWPMLNTYETGPLAEALPGGDFIGQEVG